MSSFRESISAFGPHKHKIALSTASAAAIACAVFGSTVGQTPAAHAAAVKTVGVSQASAATPKATAPVSAPASASSSTAAVTKAAAPATAKAVASTPAVAVPATTATTARAAATTVAADPYAGLSPYQIAEKMVPANQFAAFSWIVTHESGWDVTATNASSGAYGLGQALPASKMAAYGSDYRTNPATQIKWALSYMNDRYGSPNAAQVWWENHGWY